MNSLSGLKGFAINRLLRPASLVVMLFTGCQSLPSSGRADRTWLRDLQNADLIVVRCNESEQALVDPVAIKRLAEIYADGKWEPYRTTLPAHFDERSIDIYSGDVKLRHMSYTGVLWENERYDSNRTASLNSEDRDWVESLFEAATIDSSINAR